MTDLQKLLDASPQPSIGGPAGTAIELGSAAVMGMDALKGAAAGAVADKFSSAAGDHMEAFARSGDLTSGAIAALVGAVKPESKHDKASLAVAASLAQDPAAAALGYGAVQLGGDYLGGKGVAAVKMLAAGAGIAAGGPALLGAIGLYQGGREMVAAFDKKPGETADHIPDSQMSYQPSLSATAFVPPPAEAIVAHELVPEPEIQVAMGDLGWGPGR